jgi:hypothetical protein
VRVRLLLPPFPHPLTIPQHTYAQCCDVLCQHKRAAGLYERLSELMAARCEVLLATCLRSVRGAEAAPAPTPFLEVLAQLWADYCQHTIVIHHIFFPLDRTYVLLMPVEARVKLIWDLGLDHWRRALLGHELLRSRLLADLLSAIRVHR